MKYLYLVFDDPERISLDNCECSNQERISLTWIIRRL